MPKFSAYMRGEEGPQGNVGQAVLLNGIVSSSSELPPNTENQKNLVYYVGNNEEDYHLYVYTTTEEQWQDLGNIAGPKGSDGPAAGFSPNQNSEIYAVDPEAEPQISIIPDSESPDTAKVFNFTFGIPRGQNAGFSTNQNIEIESVSTIQEMYASVSTDENSPNTAKVFNFKFGIPRGESADFGEPTASISTISSFSTPSVNITSSGSATSKIFDFHFDIPQGMKGDRGDSFSIYEPIAFTTGTGFWVNTTTFVYPRGDNSKLPIYIYNEDTDELDNSFIFTSTEIIYNSEQPFNGSIYLMAPSNRPSITIGEVSTTSYEGQMSVSLNELSTSSDAIIDFTLASGPNGEAGGFGEVTSSAELIPSSSTYIEKDSIVSFSTDYDINDVTVDIEPMQNLHGYDHPWPAGGGKNLLPLTLENLKVSNTDGTWSGNVYTRNGITATCNINDDGSITDIIIDGTSIDYFYLRALLNSPLPIAQYTFSSINSVANSNVQLSLRGENASASQAGTLVGGWHTLNTINRVFSFTSDADAYCFQIQIDTNKTISNFKFSPMLVSGNTVPNSYEPYSNICPISGWTGANVTRTGKNILPKLLNTEEIGETRYSLTSDGNSVTLNGTVTGTNGAAIKGITDYFFIKAGTYILSGNNPVDFPKQGEAYIQIRFINKITGESPNEYRLTLSEINASKVMTFTSDTYMRLDVRTYKNIELDNFVIKPMLYLVSEADTSFESSQFTTYPISWSTQAGTVYGGSLDVTTGVLTVTHEKIQMDGVTSLKKVNAKGSGSNNYYYNLPSASLEGRTEIGFYSGSILRQLGYKCSHLITCDRAESAIGFGAYLGDQGKTFQPRFYFPDDYPNIQNIEDCNQWFADMLEAGTPVEFTYKLKEPITYQLTPTQITALLGQNNIWADTGDVQVSYNKFNQPYVEITTDEDSPNTAKRFNFHFGIPQGEKGAPGDAFAIYEPLSFTTGSSYWMENILAVPRGDNNKLPLFIYNRDNNNIAATFKLENDYIIHEADSPFNGTLYMMSQTNRSTLRIGNVSTTTYGNGSSFSLNEASTSTDAIFDVVLEQGPKGETALTAQVGRVSYTSGIPNVEIEGGQNLIFNFDLPRGFKGDKGDTFTVDVNNTIDILNYNETPIVETTSTSTGIALKFKLPPSVSAQLGDLSQYNSISLTTNLITGILPVNKGGTGANQLTTNAVILGNNTSAVKQKATANGAFFATGKNKEPGFGILPIAQGGTGTTTAAAAWTALGGGESGKHPDSYFALAEHGTHVSYGTTVTAIGTASAGTASTVSRSDHVHNISVTTGDANGQVKIAGTNIAVKGLKSAAYTESSAYAAASHTHSYLPLSGGTLTGQLTLSADGYKTASTAGYATDQLGNFIHQSANNNDYFYIGGADGTSENFSVYFDTGNVTMAGGLTIGGGSQITKVTFTNVDPGANSNLPTGNIVFVYE